MNKLSILITLLQKLNKLGFILFLLIITFGLTLILEKSKPGPHARPDYCIYILNDSTAAVNHGFEWIDTIPINDIENYIRWESNLDN